MRHTAESVIPGPMGPVAYFVADGVGEMGVIDGPYSSGKRAQRAALASSIGTDAVVITGAHGARAAADIAAYLNRKAGDR